MFILSEGLKYVMFYIKNIGMCTILYQFYDSPFLGLHHGLCYSLAPS